jgi:hypothetical protein
MFKIVITVFTSLFLWEHFGRINDIDSRPTLLIEPLTEFSKCLFIEIGSYFAWISGYAYHLKLGEMAFSLCNLLEAILLFLCTPIWTVKGFIETAYNDYGNPKIIFIGAIVLVFILFAMIITYRDRLPLLRLLDYSSVVTYFSNGENQVKLIVFPIVCSMWCYYYYSISVYPTINITGE